MMYNLNKTKYIFLVIAALIGFFSCNKKTEYESVISNHVNQIYDSVLNSHPPHQRRIDSLYKIYKHSNSDSIKIENLITVLNYLPGGVKSSLRKEISKASKKLNYERGYKKIQLYSLHFYGSKSQTDSVNRYYNIIKKWAEEKKDVNIWCENEIYYGNYFAYKRQFNISDSIILAAIEKLKSQKINDNNLFSIAFYILGRSRNVQFLNSEAVNYLNQAAEYALRDELYDNAADIYFRIGECYLMEADFNNALDAYGKALDVALKINDQNSVASIYGAIGEIYSTKGEFIKAEDYLFKSYELAAKVNYAYQEAYTSASIAYMYFEQNKYDTAIKYFDRSSELYEKIGKDRYGYEIIRNTLSKVVVYNSMKQYEKAKELLDVVMASEYAKEDPSFDSEANLNLAEFYLAQHKVAEAEKLALKALSIAKENQFLTIELEIYKKLYQVYETNRNFEKAYLYHKLFTQLNDSLTNKPQIKKFAELENKMKEDRLKAEHDKKELTLLSEKRDREAELKNEKNQRYYLYGGLLLVIVFAAFMYNRYKISQEQKLIIEKQKMLVEEKQKEIVDSIQYAKKIQRTLLAHDAFLNQELNDYFILYKPKDIVSGDFYWATKKENRFYFAVCDSTGHGVPGAFMSLLNASLLNEAIVEKGIVKPGDVFNYVRSKLISNMSAEAQKDGMDGVLICMDKSSGEISYAAANNKPLLITEKQVVELPGDKMPIGIGEKKDDFTTHTINYTKGDRLYLFTDGYADQFGGEKGKKFKHKQLEQLIAEVNHKASSEKKEILNQTFENWRGSLEQVDDVCIAGLVL